MAGLLKVAGGLVVGFAILAIVVTLFAGGMDSLLAVLPDAVSGTLGGLLIIAFGVLLEHLETISRHSARQADLLTELLRQTPKGIFPHPASRDSAAKSLDQLAQSNFRFKEI